MYQFILFIHVLTAAFIILLVLIQQGKGATMGAAFGSGASSTVFGSRGSGSFLFRITMSCIAIFFITSITLNYLATQAYKDAGSLKPAGFAPASTRTTPPGTTPVPVVPAVPATPATAPGSDQPAPLTDQIPVKK